MKNSLEIQSKPPVEQWLYWDRHPFEVVLGELPRMEAGQRNTER